MTLTITASEAEAAFRMLVVDPAVRGRGIGEALVAACLERAAAAGKTSMVLSTDPRMHAAHRLHGRRGFTRLPDRDCRRTSLPPTPRKLGAGPCKGAEARAC